MHLVLETADEQTELLIPSGSVVAQVIQKKKRLTSPKLLETVLTLDPLTSEIGIGSTVVFTGRLLAATSGKPLSDAVIKILESDLAGDDLLALGVTESDGRFSIEWPAKRTDWKDDTAEIYAKFEGDRDYREAQSEQFPITVKGRDDRK